ncbi:ATP-binding protein [Burkholderia glumae]|uniref:histidine kinase n=1 Tax=Burkholderia glumae TaxID=337 RepID=A0AAP9XVL3_BURGL|nr:ATP-binding protein [Burkholderia glumae]ACR32191.1 Multi-sensor signal transduction histidine kinase [Burkholderia glumae BGR1]AJY63129.1 GAF domain protein [Burkholderia glumae LMG 2196 = ATCC 33617]MCM2484626.1 ATP-binding protein [Burkholderia glumae]MCM2510319.1 ATP-binding protein [Burkholderia glumae]MCM2540084.1 ATP-binding protein [Burkholderia glumae]
MAAPLPPASDSIGADCAREPIHIPGGIQPHGFLFSIDDAGIVIQASENAVELVGGTPDALPGLPLARFLGAHWAATVSEALRSHESNGLPLYVGSMDDPRADGTARRSPFAIVVHRHERVAIVELEPARGTSDVFASMYPLVRTFINRLEDVETTADLARLAATEVQRITGFGRTLVYNFDEQGNGHVIAECIEPGYTSYADQHFPASDIPAQARALYVRNRIRLIADADYQPARLVPPLHPATQRPTDLTYASLRSVSPVHVQYMKNMGTLASMSMSIVVNGKLWGLISCHHDAARVPPFEVRTACEHIAQVLSLQIEAKEEHAEAELRLDLRHLHARLLASMADTESFVDALAEDPRDLLRLTHSAGVAIVFEGRVVLAGLTPPEAQVGQLVKWLDTQIEEVFWTDNLARDVPVIEANPDYAGALAVSISRLFRNYIVWFRPEVVKTIKWAGDPREKLAPMADSLSPRKSFDVWTDIVRGYSPPWRQAEREIALEFRAALLGIVLRRAEELADLALELGRANQELEGFSYTVSHDLRAPLRHIVGYADLLREMEMANLSERGRHYVERIVNSARLGGKLVDDLLAFSRMGRSALRPQKIDMRALADALIADETRDALQGAARGSAAAPRRIEWRVGELGHVTADPVLIHLVLRNLIENAVKFSAAQEVAHIEIGRYEGERELAGHDVFFVKDDGVGFDMRYVDKLFGVFQRLHHVEEFDGTGIGLASVKRIIERHGGKVWARGEPGRGATISFTLPRVFAGAAVELEETSNSAVARLEALAPARRTRAVPKQTK